MGSPLMDGFYLPAKREARPHNAKYIIPATFGRPGAQVNGTRPTRPELQNLVNRRDSSDMQKTRKPSRPVEAKPSRPAEVPSQAMQKTRHAESQAKICRARAEHLDNAKEKQARPVSKLDKPTRSS